MVVGRKIESDFPRCLLLQTAAASRFYLLKFSPFFFSLGWVCLTSPWKKQNTQDPGPCWEMGTRPLQPGVSRQLPAPGGFRAPAPRVSAATTAPRGAGAARSRSRTEPAGLPGTHTERDVVRAAEVAPDPLPSHAGADIRPCSKGENPRLGRFVLHKLPRRQTHAGW